MIRHISGSLPWQVVSESGKNLGKYKSRSEAVKRLQSVEYWKKVKGHGKNK